MSHERIQRIIGAVTQRFEQLREQPEVEITERWILGVVTNEQIRLDKKRHGGLYRFTVDDIAMRAGRSDLFGSQVGVTDPVREFGIYRTLRDMQEAGIIQAVCDPDHPDFNGQTTFFEVCMSGQKLQSFIDLETA